MSTPVSRLLRFGGAVAVAIVVLGHGRPANADIRCFQDLKDCYYSAAGKATFVDMWLAGLDCELAFTDCSRRAILGR